MAQPNYKFKPYKPTKFKTKKVGTEDLDKQISSLAKQRENLDKRLRAEGIDPETLGGEFDNRNILEKALNLKPNQGLLMDFFEVIERPVQAVKQSIMAGKQGDSILQGFADGLAGNKEISGSDFITELTGFKPEGGFAKFVTNVGADIVFDPLTYLPPGIIAKGFSALNKLGGRAATEAGVEALEIVVKNVDGIVDAVNKGDDTLKPLIKTQKQIDGLLNGKISGFGEAAEVGALSDLNDGLDTYLKQEGLEDFRKDFAAVSTGSKKDATGRFIKDTKIYYKAKKDTWVEVAVIEAKDFSADAFGFKSSINLDDLSSADKKKLSSQFLDRWENATELSAQGRAKGKDIVEKIKNGTITTNDAKKAFSGLSKKDMEVLDNITEDIFYKDLAESRVSHISVRHKDANKNILLSIDDAKKMIKVKAGTLTYQNTGNLSGEAFALLKKRMNPAVSAKFGGRVYSGKTKALLENHKNIQKYFNVRGKAKGQTAEVIAKLKRAGFNTQGLISKKSLQASNRGIFVAGVNPDDAKDILEELINSGVVSVGTGDFKAVDGMMIDDDVLFISGNKVDETNRMIKSDIALQKGVTSSDLLAADSSASFLQDVITKKNGAPAVSESITFTQRFGEGDFGPFLQRVAKSLKEFSINFKTTFNLTAGFDEQTKALLRKAYGGDMFDLERRSGILADIKKKLVAVDPNAGELLGEIIEADAKIVNGKIVKLKREMGTGDFFDYMYNVVAKGDGDKIPIPKFSSRTSEQNFLRALDDIVFNSPFASKKKLFTTAVGDNGGMVLKFAGDAGEMKTLSEFVANSQAKLVAGETPKVLKFGQTSLSKEAKAFLRNNTEVIGQFKQLTDELLDDLVNKAGFKNLPTELQNQIGYMRHTMSKEAMEGLRKQMPGVLSIYKTPGKNTLGQRFFPGSVKEINAVMMDFYGMTDDFFDPNAFNAMEDFITQVSRKNDQKQVLDIILTNKGVDGSDLFKVVDNTQEVKSAMSPYDRMFKDFKEDFGSLYNNLSDESKKVFDDFLKKNGFDGTKAIQMNKSAYNVLKGVEKAYFDVPKLAKIYDKFLNTWKGLTLITPGFHMRNLFGNMFNSYAVGMDIAAQGKYLGLATQELSVVQDIGKKLAQGVDITDAERAIFESVKGYFEQGVSQTHRGIRDLEQVMDASAKGAAAGGLKGTYNNVVRINFNFAEKMDDVQRYALYKWSLDKTGDATKAANTVAEALFDYSHLTPFEKSYMKRLFPFYTFMKNNFVFQMKNIFKNPAQYAKLGRAYKYASEDLAGYSLDDLPDYATENMWIPLPWTVDKNDKDAVAFLKATLPASDFTELVENPFKKGVTSITAPIKLLIEFGAGKDLFTGQPLEAFPGQTSAMPEGTGVLSGLRDRRGNLTISQSPLFIKIMNDLGLRAPINIASAGLDIVDTLAGYQGGLENVGDFLQRAGVAGVSEMDRLKLSKLYQDLEKLRELKKFYEQETGNQLPVLPRG